MPPYVAPSGRQVPELALTPQLLIDRTTVLYGASSTGKTVLIKNIMKQLQTHVEQIFVIAPTEPSNRSYDGFVDPALIHYRMYLPDPAEKRDTEQKAALRFLERIYQRQEMMAAIYTRANQVDVLTSLYARLGARKREESNRLIATLERKRRQVVHDIQKQYGANPGQCDQKVKESNEQFTQMLVLLYKKILAAGVDELWAKKDLTENERYSLHYLHFNPRLLLIFDDCAAELKPFFGKEVFRKLFYQNRHSFITLVASFQDDTDLPANLRKNAFVSFFMSPVACTANFTRASNNFSKDVKEFILELANDIYVGYRKLAYIREDKRGHHFYHIECEPPRPFRFGSAALGELCDQVRSEGVTMDRENPFYAKFRV
jgi:hypothetical protein